MSLVSCFFLRHSVGLLGPVKCLVRNVLYVAIYYGLTHTFSDKTFY